ncbi:TAT leader-containing periplasmic protein [Shewanella glacialimarina]|jgi:hypothetical protein|uniref:TAT leader-containing periplasmic protein n=1 Tax=Shewanella glacialimarina TaxID=2590884 RepID=UPI001CF820BA|nr:TAT leader-containing periplasmic protein [Shewanella glacialimarina]UCX05921.1 TAT leader-containing periplasmic protein [Shewanella glacialimarina]
MKRRTFLTGAFAGTAVLALGINLYPSDPIAIGGDSQYRVLFSVLIPVLLDGALPEVASQRKLAIDTTIDAIQASIDVLPTDQQAELSELLALLESRLGLLILTGSMTPLMMRSPVDLTNMLEAWRFHYLDMVQTAYLGLRELILASYYATPAHWGKLGYAKPTFLLNA